MAICHPPILIPIVCPPSFNLIELKCIILQDCQFSIIRFQANARLSFASFDWVELHYIATLFNSIIKFHANAPGPRICGGVEAAPPGSKQLSRLWDYFGPIFLLYQPDSRDCILFNTCRIHWHCENLLWVKASDQRSRIWNFSQAPRAC